MEDSHALNGVERWRIRDGATLIIRHFSTVLLSAISINGKSWMIIFDKVSFLFFALFADDCTTMCETYQWILWKYNITLSPPLLQGYPGDNIMVITPHQLLNRHGSHMTPTQWRRHWLCGAEKVMPVRARSTNWVDDSGGVARAITMTRGRAADAGWQCLERSLVVRVRWHDFTVLL